MSIRVIAPLEPAEPPADKYLVFLDELRQSGRTNMFGATPYLTRQFPELSIPAARRILGHWMDTFARRHHIEEA